MTKIGSLLHLPHDPIILILILLLHNIFLRFLKKLPYCFQVTDNWCSCCDISEAGADGLVLVFILVIFKNIEIQSEALQPLLY